MGFDYREIGNMALSAVWAHKLRSGLTILGIVIGITTVVTVASLLTGLNQHIVDFFKDFGPNSIFLSRVSGDPNSDNAPPTERRRRPIKPEYAAYFKNFVHSIDGVALSEFIPPGPGTVMTAKVPGFESDNMGLVGAEPEIYSITPRDLRAGRLFTSEENRRGSRVAVLGSELADALFPANDAPGRTLTVDGTQYTVVGVFDKAKGGFFGENELDRQVIIPYQTAHLRYPAVNSVLMTFEALPGRREDAVGEIRDTLRKLRHLKAGTADDFSLTTPDSIIQSFNKITSMVVLISIAVSAVGLLVGGIGVMNIMLVSVTERTREIGVRKAIGARRKDIIAQFLTEAVALTGFGGVVGVVFSILLTVLISGIFPSLTTKVPTWAVTTAFAVSVGIGVFFGVWPAILASRLDPVEALRYE
jgi:putative ABC transport system permease protein